MATSPTSTSSPSKTDFVSEYLESNPTSGAKAVNNAWSAAGYEGTISDTLVHRLRSAKGLTGNRRPGREPGEVTVARASQKKSGRKQGRPARSEASSPADVSKPEKAAPPKGRGTSDLEAEFDRLLFRIMDRGMPDVEEAIRHARRLLVLHEGR